MDGLLVLNEILKQNTPFEYVKKCVVWKKKWERFENWLKVNIVVQGGQLQSCDLVPGPFSWSIIHYRVVVIIKCRRIMWAARGSYGER